MFVTGNNVANPLNAQTGVNHENPTVPHVPWQRFMKPARGWSTIM